MKELKNGSLALLLFDNDTKVLLVKHVFYKGQLGLPGGGIDKGENPLEAVQRELFEELKVNLEKKRFTLVMSPTKFRVRYNRDNINYIYLVHMNELDKKNISESFLSSDEISAYMYFPLSDLEKNKKKLLNGTYQILNHISSFPRSKWKNLKNINDSKKKHAF